MKKFARTILPVMLVLFLCSMDKVKFKKHQLTEGVTAKIPEVFVPMSDEDIGTKYPSTKKPLAMFTSMDRMADFGLNVTKANWAGNDLNLLKEIYKSTLYTLYNEVYMLQEDIKTINKQDFIVLEFTSKVDHTKKYTYLQYGVFNDRVYIFNFTGAERDKEKWQPMAQQIMESIKVKPRKLNDIEYNPAGEMPRKAKNAKQVLKDQKRRMGNNAQKTTSK